MKKVILSLVLLLSAVNVASASVDCAVTPNDPACFAGNGDPLQATQVWGLTGHQTPIVKAGTITTDKFGTTDLCPAFYASLGCMDISATDYYISREVARGRELVAVYGLSGALTKFPSLAGLINSLR